MTSAPYDLATYITDNDRERSCTAHMLDDLNRVLPRLDQRLNGRERYLDIGCGFGGLARAIGCQLRMKQVHGIDIDPSVVPEASEKGVDVSLCELGTDQLPYESGTFDLVTSFGMLDYLPTFDDALRDIKRVLKPGAYAVASLPNLAAWHNRLFLLMGYQPRDVEVSREIAVGSPPFYGSDKLPIGHIHTATTAGFRQLMEYVGFRTVAVLPGRPVNKTKSRLIDGADRFFSRSPHWARRFIYVGQKP